MATFVAPTPARTPLRIARPGVVRARWRTGLLTVADGVAAGGVALLLGLPLAHAGAAVVVWMVLVAAAGEALVPGRGVAGGVLRAAVAAGLACWLVGLVVPLPVDDDRLFALVAACAVGSWLVRAIARPTTLRVLVIGDGDKHLALSTLPEGSQGRLQPVGYCAPEEAALAVLETGPDAVLVLPGVDGRMVRRLSWALESFDLPLLVGTGLVDVAVRRSQAVRLGSVGAVRVLPPPTGAGRWVKQLWERAAAAAALVLAAPLLLVVAVAIRLDSHGPVLFRQTRIGRHGRPFTMVKLRTMTTDAEARKASLGSREGHVLFKLTDDPRITRVGRWLRRTSLDELPQLINVVRGEMSLVGPRPALPDEVARYDIDPLRRLAVTPGLTGLWQVSGRSDLSWEESVRLDLDYVDNWSLSGDLSILLRTVRAVLSGRGAY